MGTKCSKTFYSDRLHRDVLGDRRNGSVIKIKGLSLFSAILSFWPWMTGTNTKVIMNNVSNLPAIFFVISSVEKT